MRVYATTLWLDGDQGTGPILRTVGSWLLVAERRNASARSSAGTRRRTVGGAAAAIAKPGATQVETIDLTTPGARTLVSGARLDVVYTESGSPYLHSIRYSHRDAQERGRSWVTEIGIRAQAGAREVECSVYLYTDDVSTRVATPVVATRPTLIRDLLRRCRPTDRTNGLVQRNLTRDSATELAAFARSTDRDGPLVVVSPRPDGSHPVDVVRLQDLLAGLATLAVIPAGEDTRHLATIFGDGLTPYAGAVAVLFPVRPGPYAAPVPVRRLLSVELEELDAAGRSREDELFVLATERMNVLNARRHISPDVVHRERARRSIVRHARADASVDELQLWSGELERETTRLEDEVRKLRREAEADEYAMLTLNDEVDQLKEELHRTRATSAVHVAQLSAARDGRAVSMADLEPLRVAFRRALGGNPTPEDGLRLLRLMYGDRVVVLESALASARDATGFRSGAKVFDLLLALAGPYWEALSAGRPDAEARKAFPPKRFAAKESETLSASGRAKRTFMYKGAPVFMEPHLKAGDTGGSADTTLRIHFQWDAEDRRVVIGHCGPHIPF
jgi:hypothetical protein